MTSTCYATLLHRGPTIGASVVVRKRVSAGAPRPAQRSIKCLFRVKKHEQIALTQNASTPPSRPVPERSSGARLLAVNRGGRPATIIRAPAVVRVVASSSADIIPRSARPGTLQSSRVDRAGLACALHLARDSHEQTRSIIAGEDSYRFCGKSGQLRGSFASVLASSLVLSR